MLANQWTRGRNSDAPIRTSRVQTIGVSCTPKSPSARNAVGYPIDKSQFKSLSMWNDLKGHLQGLRYRKVKKFKGCLSGADLITSTLDFLHSRKEERFQKADRTQAHRIVGQLIIDQFLTIAKQGPSTDSQMCLITLAKEYDSSDSPKRNRSHSLSPSPTIVSPTKTTARSRWRRLVDSTKSEPTPELAATLGNLSLDVDKMVAADMNVEAIFPLVAPVPRVQTNPLWNSPCTKQERSSPRRAISEGWN